jgi:hypothetical protein
MDQQGQEQGPVEALRREPDGLLITALAWAVRSITALEITFRGPDRQVMPCMVSMHIKGHSTA